MKGIWNVSVRHHTVKSMGKSRSNIMCRPRAPILCNPVPLSGQRGMMPMPLESDRSFSYCFLLRIRIASTDAEVSTTLNVRPSSRISGQGEGAASSSRGLLHIMVAMREMIRTKRGMKIKLWFKKTDRNESKLALNFGYIHEVERLSIDTRSALRGRWTRYVTYEMGVKWDTSSQIYTEMYRGRWCCEISRLASELWIDWILSEEAHEVVLVCSIESVEILNFGVQAYRLRTSAQECEEWITKPTRLMNHIWNSRNLMQIQMPWASRSKTARSHWICGMSMAHPLI